MGWEQIGYGIAPIMGAEAPTVNAFFSEGKTGIKVEFSKKLTEKELMDFCDAVYDLGKLLLKG